MDERAVARRAANSAYAMRICGNTIRQKAYYGNFDYIAVVEAAEIPGPGIKDHVMYWRRMWKMFDEAWSKYAQTN